MANTVFILGAGASRSAGGPLVKDFLDIAFDLHKRGGLGDAEKRDFELVQQGLNALQLAHSKARLDITNLEDVFDAFEMAALVGRLGNLDREQVARLPEAMRTLITVTLEQLIRLPVQGREMLPCPAHADFARTIQELRRRAGSWPAVITFNYDVCLDHALWCVGVPSSYRLAESDQQDWVSLLKLHGSLNWAHCPDCGTVQARSVSEQLERMPVLPGSKAWRLEVAAKTVQSFRCGTCGKHAGQLMIVPPTWAKAQYQALLRPVWAAAAGVLRDAENIFVCGYSLSETDTFFRYLYAVGSIGEATLRRFWVFNPDASLEGRFREFLGPQAENRFQFHGVDFDNMVRHVAQEMLRGM